MKANPEDVQSRILVAARQEFARFGLAGARIDRIATLAHASKERLYAYYSDKASLFQSVLNLNSMEFFDSVSLAPQDVAEFVGEIYDHALSNPEHIRMLTWARLDGLQFEHPAGDSAPEAKLRALKTAQDLGFVDAIWDPADLLAMLFGIGLAWVQAPNPEVLGATDKRRTSQRDAAVEAARRLIAPSGQ
jgi:AcrR family transcriptional regulator